MAIARCRAGEAASRRRGRREGRRRELFAGRAWPDQRRRTPRRPPRPSRRRPSRRRTRSRGLPPVAAKHTPPMIAAAGRRGRHARPVFAAADAGARLPAPAEEFRERTTALRLAWAAGRRASPPPINLLPVPRLRHDSKTLASRRGGRRTCRRPEYAGDDIAVGDGRKARTARDDPTVSRSAARRSSGGSRATAKICRKSRGEPDNAAREPSLLSEFAASNPAAPRRPFDISPPPRTPANRRAGRRLR